jgi:hypothetical protein
MVPFFLGQDSKRRCNSNIRDAQASCRECQMPLNMLDIVEVVPFGDLRYILGRKDGRKGGGRHF